MRIREGRKTQHNEEGAPYYNKGENQDAESQFMPENTCVYWMTGLLSPMNKNTLLYLRKLQLLEGFRTRECLHYSTEPRMALCVCSPTKQPLLVCSSGVSRSVC